MLGLECNPSFKALSMPNGHVSAAFPTFNRSLELRLCCHTVSLLPVRLLLRLEYNTAEYLGRVDCPVLIVHSRDDEIMPFSQARRLFELARGPKKFLEIAGTHNEGFITSGRRYEEGLNAFISQYVEPKP